MYPPSQSYRPYHDTSSEDASVHGEDEAFLEKATVSRPQRRWYHPKSLLKFFCCGFSASILSCFLSIITIGLVIFAMFLLSAKAPAGAISTVQSRLCPDASSSIKPAGQLQHMHCGSTPDEARALDCTFDMMSFAWTPRPCYDSLHEQETISRTGPWNFYLDHNATQPLAMAQLENELIVWTEHSYHVSHCLYAWERLHRSYLSHQILPGEVASINHTLHCRDFLNDRTPPKKIDAVAYMVFDSCISFN